MEALHIHYSVQETECCKVSRDLWVIAQHELTLDYRGSDRSLLRSLLLLSTRFFLSPWPLRPSARKPRREPEIVSQLPCGQPAGDGCACVAADRMTDSPGSLVSLRRLTTDSHAWWGKGFPCVTALLGPQWDLRGKWSEECGRRRRGGGSEVGWPVDNTWQETDRFDMRTCPHLCCEKRDTGLAAADGVSKYSHPTLLKSNTLQTEFQQCT